ncbi:hypothetical protein [Maricaulis sp.]|uniref:hypothetical protein n=1 Tax=Maricaulis sp. TaxID=1486257 RepID=UPI00261EFEAA|nr:hypothetical protein [Maricaulis sp.]
MMAKSFFIAGLASILASLPVTVPVISGTPVTVTVGGIALEIDRRNGVDIDLDPVCFVQTCPLAQLRIGADDAPVYLTGV